MHFPSEVTISCVHRHVSASISTETAPLLNYPTVVPPLVTRNMDGAGRVTDSFEAIVPVQTRITRPTVAGTGQARINNPNVNNNVFTGINRSRSFLSMTALDDKHKFEGPVINDRTGYFKQAVGYVPGTWTNFFNPFWLFSLCSPETPLKEISIASTTVVRLHGWDFENYPAWIAYWLVLRHLLPRRHDLKEFTLRSISSSSVDLETAGKLENKTAEALGKIHPYNSVVFCTENSDTVVALLPSTVIAFSVAASGASPHIEAGVSEFFDSDEGYITDCCNMIYDILYDVNLAASSATNSTAHEAYINRMIDALM